MAVDVQAITTSYGEQMRRVRTETLLQLRHVLSEQLSARPEERDELMAELRRIRQQFRDAGREDMEDIVLDGMDMLTGWVAPGGRP